MESWDHRGDFECGDIILLNPDTITKCLYYVENEQKLISSQPQSN